QVIYNSMATSRRHRHNVVMELLKRYKEKTGKDFKYPKSNIELEKLRTLLRYDLALVRSAIDGHDKS
ncbi:hypothetical protein ACJMK2_035506, partial [Sinanodonta woodiana]